MLETIYGECEMVPRNHKNLEEIWYWKLVFKKLQGKKISAKALTHIASGLNLPDIDYRSQKEVKNNL